MNKNYLQQFLNQYQQNSLKNYEFIEGEEIKKLKPRVYVKYMDKRTMSFCEGGILMENLYPIIKLKNYFTKRDYCINTDYNYIFWKRNVKSMSKREYLIGLLDSLEKK